MDDFEDHTLETDYETDAEDVLHSERTIKDPIHDQSAPLCGPLNEADACMQSRCRILRASSLIRGYTRSILGDEG